MITCISGSSYFFIIVVIILLRRQFRKPEQSTDKQEVSKDFELKTQLNPTEDTRASSESPKPPPATKIWVNIATEEGEDVHTTEQLPQKEGFISTNNAQETKYVTDSCAEVTLLSSNGANIEMVCKETTEHKVLEKQDGHTGESGESK